MIQKFNHRQIDTIMRIWLEGNLDAHPFIDPQYWQNQSAAVRSAIQEADVYCYQEAGRVLGFIGLQGDYIAGIFVARHARDRGIGHQLITFIQAQHQHLTLDAYCQNKGAIHFYQRHHFRIACQNGDEAHLVWDAD